MFQKMLQGGGSQGGGEGGNPNVDIKLLWNSGETSGHFTTELEFPFDVEVVAVFGQGGGYPFVYNMVTDTIIFQTNGILVKPTFGSDHKHINYKDYQYGQAIHFFAGFKTYQDYVDYRIQYR